MDPSAPREACSAIRRSVASTRAAIEAGTVVFGSDPTIRAAIMVKSSGSSGPSGIRSSHDRSTSKGSRDRPGAATQIKAWKFRNARPTSTPGVSALIRTSSDRPFTTTAWPALRCMPGVRFHSVDPDPKPRTRTFVIGSSQLSSGQSTMSTGERSRIRSSIAGSRSMARPNRIAAAISAGSSGRWDEEAPGSASSGSTSTARRLESRSRSIARMPDGRSSAKATLVVGPPSAGRCVPFERPRDGIGPWPLISFPRSFRRVRDTRFR